MNIVFFGTSEFALSSLKALTKSSHKPALVVTKPEQQKGRGLKVSPTVVEEYAKANRLKIFTARDINLKASVDAFKEARPDLFVVVDFGQILSQEVLDIPELYSINLHASLLPKYRGAAPIQWAIINGDQKTGVTVMRINQVLDSGDIILQKEADIDSNEDASALNKRLSSLGAELLMETIDEIESGIAEFRKQDDSKASYAPKLKKQDGLINWKKDALPVKNLIRGCCPWPSAYTYLDGKLLKILDAEVSDTPASAKPATVLKADDEGILVACGKDAILIKRLQLESRKPLNASELLRGHPILPGTRLG